MAEFSFGFTDGSFLQLNSQKHLRSVAEDLISNEQKRTKRSCQNGEGKDITKLSRQYFSAGHNFVWFLIKQGSLSILELVGGGGNCPGGLS